MSGRMKHGPSAQWSSALRRHPILTHATAETGTRNTLRAGRAHQKAARCAILLREVALQRWQGPRQGEKRGHFSMAAGLLRGVGDAPELDHGDGLDTGNPKCC